MSFGKTLPAMIYAAGEIIPVLFAAIPVFLFEFVDFGFYMNVEVLMKKSFVIDFWFYL